MRRVSLLAAVAVLAGLMAMPSAMADGEIRVSGATTLAKLIKEKQGEIETKAGVKIAVVGNGTGRGVNDLAAGTSQIALVGGPLEPAVEACNAKAETPLKLDELKRTAVNVVPVAIIVNPANSVSSVTLLQLHDVLTGKITNWKDLGGEDQKIMLVMPPAGDGVTATLKYELLPKEEFAKDARSVQLAPDVNKIVAQVPNAIAYLTVKNKAQDVKALTLDKPIVLETSIVTRGEPAGPVKAVVNAVLELIAEKK